MYRKTFELIAKYVSKSTGVRVIFDTDGGAHAIVENKEVHLPREISNHNAFAALSLLIHEACHIQHSNFDLDKFLRTKVDFNIFNCIEDVRIDKKAFNILPNIRSFYEYLVKDHINLTKADGTLAMKALCAAILDLEGFQPKMDKETKNIINNTNLLNEMNRGMWALDGIEYKTHTIDYTTIKESIANIKKILNIDDSKHPKMDFKGSCSGQGNQKGEAGEGGEGEDKDPLDGIEALLRPSSVWSKGDGIQGSGLDVPGIDLEEVTEQKFKELLTVKERKEIKNGMTLDTDNLTAYFTDEIEELFKEEKIVKKKKSKIMFLLDGSGSMSGHLLDQKTRYTVTKKCCKKIIDILEEVRHTESLDVDWAISEFTGRYIRLDKANWQQQYNANGGTNFYAGMKGAINDMMNDYTVTGKRIIVAFTDGDVSSHEIDDVEALIRSIGNDIRCLVIGVGTDLTGRMAEKITGDNVILAEEHANDVLIETIKAML